MKRSYCLAASLITCVFWALVICESDQKQQQQEQLNQARVQEVPLRRQQVSLAQLQQPLQRSTSSSIKQKRENDPNKLTEEQMKQNEINAEVEDDRIKLVEPYKSLFQTTARFALAQTKLTRHVNIETAMGFLGDLSYFLSKPANLMRAVKALAFIMASALATAFFFPGAHRFMDTILHDPSEALNLDRYLTNGISERSVLAALGSRTDETLSRVGLQENGCRQRSLCYMGEIIRCSFPETSDNITKFASENFSSTNLKDNTYARAFISGFVDRNCTSIGSSSENGRESQNCLSNFFTSVLSGIENRNSNRLRKK